MPLGQLLCCAVRFVSFVLEHDGQEEVRRERERGRGTEGGSERKMERDLVSSSLPREPKPSSSA